MKVTVWGTGFQEDTSDEPGYCYKVTYSSKMGLMVKGSNWWQVYFQEYFGLWTMEA